MSRALFSGVPATAYDRAVTDREAVEAAADLLEALADAASHDA
jgi:hypothetical protein